MAAPVQAEAEFRKAVVEWVWVNDNAAGIAPTAQKAGRSPEIRHPIARIE
jgi:hypothetical protein